MAARTTADKVRIILDTDLETLHLESYIEVANNLMNELFKNTTLSDGLLENIERWLAAHIIATSKEREAIQQKAGPAEQRFSDIYGKGLDSTSYGQMAIALDPTGILFDINAQRRPIKIRAIKT